MNVSDTTSGEVTRLMFVVERDGLTLHNYGGWPRIKRLVNRLTALLAAMEGGPKPHQVVPVAFKTGSVGCALDLPPSAAPVVRRIAAGDYASWAPGERDALGQLHKLLQEDGLVARVDFDGVSTPLDGNHAGGATREVAQRLRGQLVSAGGDQPRLGIRFQDDDTLVSCRIDGTTDAQRAVVGMAGGWIYRDVLVEGVAKRSVADGALLGFDVATIEAAPPPRRPRLGGRVNEVLRATEFDLSGFE